MADELENYTKDQMYAVLTACDSRTRNDVIYHCRKAAEQMTEDHAKTTDEEQRKELDEEISLMRSVQTLAARAEQDMIDMDK